MDIVVRSVTGSEIQKIIPELAGLRLKIFRNFPDLYFGDADYEARHLSDYARHDKSMCVIAEDGGELVGAALAVPFSHTSPNFQLCFIRNGMAVHDIYYFGECIMLPGYEGKGIGKKMFYERERYALKMGAKIATFCTINRAAPNGKNAIGFGDFSSFWEHMGYRRNEELQTSFICRAYGYDDEDQSGSITFWVKTLEDLGYEQNLTA